MEDSVGFQVRNPELLGIVEDTASFDANCAGSWMGKANFKEPRGLRLSACAWIIVVYYPASDW